MATKTEIRDTIHDELVDVVSEYTDSPEDHVRPNQQLVDGELPALTYELFEAPLNHGFDGDIHTHDVIYDDGVLEKIIFRRDKEMTVDIAAHAGDADLTTVDKLYAAVEDHFLPYTDQIGEPSDLHEDVEDVDLQGTEDASRPDDAVHGERLRMQLAYNRFYELTDIDVIEDIEIKFDPDKDDEESSLIDIDIFDE